VEERSSTSRTTDMWLRATVTDNSGPLSVFSVDEEVCCRMADGTYCVVNLGLTTFVEIASADWPSDLYGKLTSIVDGDGTTDTIKGQGKANAEAAYQAWKNP
jgi:hypothetical protein